LESGLPQSQPNTPSKDLEHLSPRKWNRFGDGLEEIIINTVEFYPSDYIPKQTELNVIQLQVGLPMCNKALKHADNIQESILTKEQASLIYVYTVESPFYPTLNAIMRSGTKEQILPFQDYIFYLTKSLKLIDPFAGLVYRGIDSQISDYQPGKTIIWPAFSSSTQDPKVAIKFLKGKSGTLFLINAKTPRSIAKYSTINTEQEVLFLPNSSFKIIHQVSGANVALLEQALKVSLAGIIIFELNEI